jgi:signal transduction histidine kinase
MRRDPPFYDLALATMNRLLPLLCWLLLFAATAQGQDSVLRGRALFLELERAKSLTGDAQALALVQLARNAGEPSRDLVNALRTAGAYASSGMDLLVTAAMARMTAMARDRSSTSFIRLTENLLARVKGDTATKALFLLADAAAFAGFSEKSAVYRLKVEAALQEQGLYTSDRLANLDALTRISNEPAASAAYTALLRDGSISEQDRVHILSRLLINLYRLDARSAMGDPWQQLQAALRKPPPAYDRAEVALASAFFAESAGRPLEARNWFQKIPGFSPSPSVTEGLIALADFHSRSLRPDSAALYFQLASKGTGWRDVPGISWLWQQAWTAHQTRMRNPSLPALQGKLREQDSLYRSELQANTRELGLQYQVLENAARNRALRDQQLLSDLQLKQQRQRSLIWILALSLLALAAAGTAAFFYQRRRHAAKLYATELQRLELEHRGNLVTELNAAQEAERSRIAGELHDDVGTLLSVARMNLSAGNDAAHLATAGKLLGEIAQTIRTMSHQLMPVALQQYGFKNAVQQLITDINAAQQLPVELAMVGFDTSRLTPAVYSTCYRMLQELLQNILKHSGAKHALVQLVEHPDALSLIVEDDGRGIGEGQSHDGRGLKLLASRVAFLGGTMQIDSNDGQGTVVLIDIPVTPVLLMKDHGRNGSDIHSG